MFPAKYHRINCTVIQTTYWYLNHVFTGQTGGCQRIARAVGSMERVFLVNLTESCFITIVVSSLLFNNTYHRFELNQKQQKRLTVAKNYFFSEKFLHGSPTCPLKHVVELLSVVVTLVQKSLI